jgi:hypothetical protein
MSRKIHRAKAVNPLTLLRKTLRSNHHPQETNVIENDTFPYDIIVYTPRGNKRFSTEARNAADAFQKVLTQMEHSAIVYADPTSIAVFHATPVEED